MTYVEGTWHTQIIKAHAEAWKSEHHYLRYLEIGVRYAPTFNAVLPYADEAYGVDIEDVRGHMQGGTFYHGSSDDFFKDYVDEYSDGFDLIFIDGLHTYDQVKKDFENAIKLTHKDTTIFLHDTWPAIKENESACGNVWEFAVELEDSPATYMTTTLRSFPGLTIVQWPAERFD